MLKIAIPVFGDRISNRLDCAENIQLTEIDNKRIINQEVIKMLADNPFQKINMLLQMNPDTLICDGITEIYKDKLSNNNIKIIPWVQGNTKDILNRYLKGEFDNSNNKLVTKE